MPYASLTPCVLDLLRSRTYEGLGFRGVKGDRPIGEVKNWLAGGGGVRAHI